MAMTCSIRVGFTKKTACAWPLSTSARVLGNLLGLAGFDQDSSEEVLGEALGDRGSVSARLGNASQGFSLEALAPEASTGIRRVAEVPIYAADALVRRAQSLQQTRDAQAPVLHMNRALFEKLGLRNGDHVRVRQGSGEAVLATVIDEHLPADCVRLATGPGTAQLGDLFGDVRLERVPAEQKVAV